MRFGGVRENDVGGVTSAISGGRGRRAGAEGAPVAPRGVGAEGGPELGAAGAEGRGGGAPGRVVPETPGEGEAELAGGAGWWGGRA